MGYFLTDYGYLALWVDILNNVDNIFNKYGASNPAIMITASINHKSNNQYLKTSALFSVQLKN